MPVVKADIVERIMEKTSLSRSQVAKAVDHLLDLLSQTLERGERIELRGFGVFKVRERKPGQWRDPRTGRPVPSYPKRSIRFKASHVFRLEIKDPSPSEADGAF